MVKKRSRWKQEHRALALGSAAVVLLAGGWLWLLRGGVREAQGPSIGGPFHLTATDGTTITDRDLRGKYLLIYFGYTSCEDVCQTTLNDVVDALARMGSRAARVQPIFITVDPERDTPQVMARYVASFGPNLMGLRGSSDAIAEVERTFRIAITVVPDDHSPGAYTIDHSAALYLMGPDGRFLAAIRADQGGKAIAAEVVRYVS